MYTIDQSEADQRGSDPVYRQLRRLIITGHYPPGARLVEDRLARDLGVSRTPIRQALARVASEGLVQTFPNRGAVVRVLGQKELADAYNLRAVVEGYAAALAATRITPADVAVAEQAAAALESASGRSYASRDDEVQFLVEQNQRFHGAIVRASGNERIQTLLPALVEVPLQYRSFNWYSPEERAISNFFHRSILRALHDRDAERARALMHEHILRGRDVLLESLAEQRG